MRRRASRETSGSVWLRGVIGLRKSWLAACLLATCAAILESALYLTPIGQAVEQYALGSWFELRGPLPPPDGVIVIRLDDATYRALGVPSREAMPRGRLAELLDVLAPLAPRAVAVDLLFDGLADPAGDEALSRALRTLPSVLPGGSIDHRARSLDGGFESARESFRAHPLFESAATAAGDPIFVVDPLDKTVHRLHHPGDAAFGFGQAAAIVAERAVPQPRDQDLINYYGGPGGIRSVSAYRVLAREPAVLEALRGKVIFIGATLSGSLPGMGQEMQLTPYGPSFGVEIHATVAANLLDGNWLRRFAPGQEGPWLLMAVWLLSLAVLRLGPKTGALIAAAAALAWSYGAYRLFLVNIFVPGASALATLLVVLFLSALLHYAAEARQRRAIKNAFAHYLAPEMVERIAREPETLELGGQMIDAVLLFSDITGFTPLAERCGPKAVSSILNRYFQAAGEAVMREQGTVVKFIGDGMFAMWNAPIPVAGAADRAVRAALAIERRVSLLCGSGELPPLHTRIGIHAGPVIAGNLGANGRFDYTAVGDAVNAASRLEQLNKRLGTSILISGQVKERMTAALEALTPMGTVQLKGKSEPLELYTPIAPGTPEEQARWREALTCREAGELDRAVSVFSQILVQSGGFSKAAAYHLEELGAAAAEGKPAAVLTDSV